MIPKLLHQSAKTRNLSWEERCMAHRIRRLLPDWQYHLWDDADNDHIMAEYFGSYLEQYRRIRFGVVKADIARYAYMHAFGGFYFDTDYKLLRPIGEDVLNQACVLPVEEGRFGDKQNFKLGNAVLGSEPEHPFWSDLIDHIFQTTLPERITDHRVVPVLTGPRGLTNFFLQHQAKYTDIIFPEQAVFYPELRLFGFLHERAGQPQGAHMCWGSWREKSLYRSSRNFIRRKVTAMYPPVASATKGVG